jgi:hypothetical protein
MCPRCAPAAAPRRPDFHLHPHTPAGPAQSFRSHPTHASVVAATRAFLASISRRLRSTTPSMAGAMMARRATLPHLSYDRAHAGADGAHHPSQVADAEPEPVVGHPPLASGRVGRPCYPLGCPGRRPGLDRGRDDHLVLHDGVGLAQELALTTPSMAQSDDGELTPLVVEARRGRRVGEGSSGRVTLPTSLPTVPSSGPLRPYLSQHGRRGRLKYNALESLAISGTPGRWSCSCPAVPKSSASASSATLARRA